jgi:CRISPR/Cas system-associated protein endoribonuclease Cas2
MKWSYWNLKSNAKRRNKVFDLTFEQFQDFCIETNYIAGKGRTLLSYSIDRINNNLGYSIGNIRCITVSENSRKNTKILNYDWQTKHASVTTHRREASHDDWFDSSMFKPDTEF